MKLKSRSTKVNKKQKKAASAFKVCVYCGSKSGQGAQYVRLAHSLAQELVRAQMDLVYGGGDVGLMGEVSREVMRLGGKVYGVIPRGLFAREVASRGITRLYKVKDMHERKAKMEKLADAFLAIPGGYGTMDELFEIITWNQIGIHQKPVVLLNYKGFYNPLLQQLRLMVREGFISSEHLKKLLVIRNLKNLKEVLRS